MDQAPTPLPPIVPETSWSRAMVYGWFESLKSMRATPSCPPPAFTDIIDHPRWYAFGYFGGTAVKYGVVLALAWILVSVVA